MVSDFLLCDASILTHLLAHRSIVTANKEVILSAGAIGSPQILMLSGIGDHDELAALGIKPQVNLPEVGKHLQDHPIMANYFTVTSNDTFDDTLRNQTRFNAFLEQWETSRSGPFADSVGLAVAYLRLPDNSTIFSNFTDPAPGMPYPIN